MTEIVAVVALGAVSWVFRAFFVVLVPTRHLPSRISRGLDFLPPAVLAAIAAVSLSGVINSADLGGSLLGLATLGLAVWVAYRFRSLVITVAVALVMILTIDLVHSPLLR